MQPLFIIKIWCNSGEKKCFSLSLSNTPMLIGQVTQGNSARSIQTSAPTAPAWTAAHVSTRSMPFTANAPQVRLLHCCEGGRVGGQGAQRSISLPVPCLLSVLIKHTPTYTQTPSEWALIPALRQAYTGPGSPEQIQQLKRSQERKSIRKGLEEE